MCFFFWHKWKAIRTEQYDGVYFDEKIGVPLTRVYYRCDKCGKIKTKKINGHWELNEITGEQK
jgi:hypothetical protein